MNSVTTLMIAVTLIGTGQVSAVKESVTDSAITGRIETTYLFNEHLNPFNINTTTQNGVVTLTGSVRNDVQKDLAEELASSYDGVVYVDNKIIVVPDAESTLPKRNLRTQLADKSISASVRTRLLYRKNLRGLKVKATTINSVVTLTGLVDSDFQREEIEHIASQTSGVDQVINQLTVRGAGESIDFIEEERSVSDEFVEKRIEKSILLNRHLSVRKVDVEVDGGVCYLTGFVQSEPEKQLAESIAMNTNGVREVRNALQIQSDVVLVEGGNPLLSDPLDPLPATVEQPTTGQLEVLEPLDMPAATPTMRDESQLPIGDDTPLFSEGAKID